MQPSSAARWFLEEESRALLMRLSRLRPFALHETVLPAAGLAPAAQVAIDRFLIEERRELRGEVQAFQTWLRGAHGASAQEMQRRFTLIRLRFNNALSHFDMFSDAITQRSESETGVLLAGLEVAAADSLKLGGVDYADPPMICYLDRGPGAAIRRARTRLAGNKLNPVAVIRVPRERMVGHGIASSLVHEVGHQGAALLGLVASLTEAIQNRERRAPAGERRAWQLWGRWISEIIADLWSIGRVGITSTLGLIGVVSLPRYFVLRINTDDPHPTPWMRVRLSCAMGARLHPHPQWDQIARMWSSLYPLPGRSDERRKILDELLAVMPAFVELLATHRPTPLKGRTLEQALVLPDRTPERLLEVWDRWEDEPRLMRSAAPSLVFAVFGQARLSGEMDADTESRLLTALLTHWALRSSLELTEICSAPTGVRPVDTTTRIPVPAAAAVPSH